MRIFAHVPDLMDRSKVAAAAPGTAFMATPTELAGAGAVAGDLVLVDLGRPGIVDVIPAVAAAGARVVGFASHVDEATLAAAREAGCAEALPRSRFFRLLPDLVAGS